jgi:hypothetical protein
LLVSDALSAAHLQYRLIGLGFAVAGALVGGYLLRLQYRASARLSEKFLRLPAWTPRTGILAASTAETVLGWWSTRHHASEELTWRKPGTSVLSPGLSGTVLFSGPPT